MDFLSHLNARRILVAESDPDTMDRTTGVLQQAGYNVQKAYYVGDALYALDHGQFDLALIDVTMRDRNQRSLSHLMENYERVRWIAVVDEGHNEPQQLLRQGAVAYLQRPPEPDSWLQQIELVLDGQSMPAPDAPAEAQRDHAGFSDILERRLIEQQTLSTLARSLSAVLDLDELLTQVVEAAVRLCNAEEGLLLLPDEERTALYIRAVKGIDSETASNFRIKTEDSLAGQVFKSGQPVLVGDQGWQKIKTEYLVRSLLYVPLSIKGQIIGVLGINNKHTDRTFTQHDSELLQDLAAHAAVAIENARLYEESVLRTQELSRLVQAGEAANSTLAIDQVLSIIAGQLIGALSMSQCYIGQWQAEQNRLETLAVCYRALWQPTNGPLLPAKNNPAIEQAFKSKRLVIQTPVQPYPAHPLAACLPHHFQAQSAAYLPLYTLDRPLGLVKLYRIETPFMEPAQVQGAQMQLQQFALDTIPILAGQDAARHQDTLFRTAQRMLDCIKAAWVEIALWNPQQRQFTIALSYGEGIWREAPRPQLDLAQFPQLARILTEQTTLTGAPTDDLSYLAQVDFHRSLLGVPLVIKGETAGLVLLTDTLQERRFEKREVELVQALVLQAANALDNARLYRDLELSLEKLHRTQSKLVQTARLTAMGELAAAVAHQINNPLTTILGDAEMIVQDMPPDDENAEGMQAILRAGKRAHEVVRRLLMMARQQTAEDILEPLDVNETINNTLALVKGHIQQGSVLLVIGLAEALPPVRAIIGQLEDVWLNLLLNARDAVAHRENPKIGIGTKYNAAKEQIEVMVWDNGVGIAEDVQMRIFEPFFTTKPAGEGTGLGLHICQQIIEKCGGSIQIQSKYNEGTRFHITLPIYRRQDAS
jgi:signal transduction histidine kinase/DNA-binding response OmpR family regulator